MLSIHVLQLRSGSSLRGDQKHLPIESSQIKPFVVTKNILFHCVSRLRNTNWHNSININILVTLNIFCILRHIQTNIIEKNIIIGINKKIYCQTTSNLILKLLITIECKLINMGNQNSTQFSLQVYHKKSVLS